MNIRNRLNNQGNGALLLCSIVLVQAVGICSAQAQDNSDGAFKLPREIVLDSRVEYYDVSGSTAEEIYASLRESAPAEFPPYFARHQWGLEWKFDYAMSLGWCEMHRVELHLTSTTTLPRWKPGPSPPASLLHRWNGFMRATHEHERGHQQFSVDAAQAVREALLDLRTTECASMSSEANAVAEKILERYVQMDEMYDVDTKHGRTQGAVWPPKD